MGGEESKQSDARDAFYHLSNDQLSGILSFLSCEDRLVGRLVCRRWVSLDRKKWSLVALRMHKHYTDTPLVHPDHLEGAVHMGAAWAAGIGAMTAFITSAVLVPAWVFLPVWAYGMASPRAQGTFISPFLDAFRLHEQGRALWEMKVVSPRLGDFCEEADELLLRERVQTAAVADDVLTLETLAVHAAAEAKRRRSALKLIDAEEEEAAYRRQSVLVAMGCLLEHDTSRAHTDATARVSLRRASKLGLASLSASITASSSRPCPVSPDGPGCYCNAREYVGVGQLVKSAEQ